MTPPDGSDTAHATATGSHSAQAGEERLLTGYSGRLFVVLSVGWLLIQMGRQLLPPLLPAIIADLSISPFQAGIALTLGWGLYALLQYPGGRLSDQLSRRTLLVAALVGSSVGFSVFLGARSYPVFVLAGAMVGAAAGLYPVAARANVSELFVARRGQAIGVHAAMGDLGGGLAAGVAVAALALAVWRTAFVPLVVALALVALAIHVWGREPYQVGRVDLAVGATARRIFANPRTRLLLVAYSLFAFTWQGATGFLPTFLQAEKGFSPAVASGGFALLFLVGAVVKPLSGAVSDRIDRRVVAGAGIAFGGVALAGVILAGSVALVIVGVVAFAVGLMAFPPAMQAYLLDAFPDRSVGGDFGAMRSVYVGIGSLGPSFVGLVADLRNYRLAFAGLVAAMLVCAGIVGWLVISE